MNRSMTTAVVALASFALAACGAGNAAGSSQTSPNGAGQRPGGRNGASGELVQMNGTTLVLNAQSGDVTVLYTSSTTFQRTSTGAATDIVVGKCIIATGQKDATGNITAATVRLSDPVNGACTLGGGPDSGRPGAGGPPTPRNTPPGGAPILSFAGGQVTAASGTSITVQPSTGASQTLTVPTSVRISKSSPASASDLALHQCLQANGTKDSAGKVTARSIVIVPAGPSGCATGGGFGGRFGGGGGRGSGPPAGGAAPGD